MVRVERFVDGLSAGDHQERVTVRIGLGGHVGANRGARAGTILDIERLVQCFAELLGDIAGVDVGRTASPEWRDDLDGS